MKSLELVQKVKVYENRETHEQKEYKYYCVVIDNIEIIMVTKTGDNVARQLLEKYFSEN